MGVISCKCCASIQHTKAQIAKSTFKKHYFLKRSEPEREFQLIYIQKNVWPKEMSQYVSHSKRQYNCGADFDSINNNHGLASRQDNHSNIGQIINSSLSKHNDKNQAKFFFTKRRSFTNNNDSTTGFPLRSSLQTFLEDYDHQIKEEYTQIRTRKLKSMTQKNSPKDGVLGDKLKTIQSIMKQSSQVNQAGNKDSLQVIPVNQSLAFGNAEQPYPYFSPFTLASGRLKINLQQRQPQNDQRLQVYQIQPVSYLCNDEIVQKEDNSLLSVSSKEKKSKDMFTREYLRKKTLSGKITNNLGKESAQHQKRKSSSSALKVSHQLKNFERTPTYDQENESNRLKPFTQYDASSASKSQYTANFFRQSVTERLLLKQLTSNSSRGPPENQSIQQKGNSGSNNGGMPGQDNSSIDGNDISQRDNEGLLKKSSSISNVLYEGGGNTINTFKKLDENYNDKANDFSERTDQIGQIYRKKSSNNVQKIQLFPNSQKNLYNQDKSPLYNVDNPILENLNTENNSVSNSQANKAYFVSEGDSQMKDDDIFSQEYTQHHPFRLQAINNTVVHKQLDHLRYIHKDTFSSNGSPDIIIRGPLDDNQSEIGTTPNNYIDHSIVKNKFNSQYQSSTFKQLDEEQKFQQQSIATPIQRVKYYKYSKNKPPLQQQINQSNSSLVQFQNQHRMLTHQGSSGKFQNQFSLHSKQQSSTLTGSINSNTLSSRDYYIQYMDDKNNQKQGMPNYNALNIKKKYTNFSVDRRKRRFTRKIASSETNNVNNDQIQNIVVQNPQNWKQKQLFQLVNNVLVPINHIKIKQKRHTLSTQVDLQQIAPNTSDMSILRLQKQEESSGSTKQPNNFQRIKTIKEVNEEMIDNYLLTNNTNTESSPSQKNKTNTNASQNQSTSQDQNNFNSSLNMIAASAAGFLQPNYGPFQNNNPYLKIKAIEQDIKNIAKSKNMIALIRKKNQELMNSQERHSRKYSDQVLFKDESQNLFRNQNSKSQIQRQESIGFDKQITPAFGQIQLPILNNNFNTIDHTHNMNKQETTTLMNKLFKPETPFGASQKSNHLKIRRKTTQESKGTPHSQMRIKRQHQNMQDIIARRSKEMPDTNYDQTFNISYQMAQQHSFKSSFRSELESSLSRGIDESFEGISYYVEDDYYDEEEYEEGNSGESIGSVNSNDLIQQTESNTVQNKLQRIGTQNQKAITGAQKRESFLNSQGVQSQIQLQTGINSLVNNVKDSQTSKNTQPRHFRLRGVISNQSSLKSTERYVTPAVDQSHNTSISRQIGQYVESTFAFNENQNLCNEKKRDSGLSLDQSIVFNDKSPTINFINNKEEFEQVKKGNLVLQAPPLTATGRHASQVVSGNQSPFLQSPFEQSQQHSLTPTGNTNSFNLSMTENSPKTSDNKSPFKSLQQLPNFGSSHSQKPSVLTTANLKLLEDPYSNRNIGPRSITTNSVISTRKNGKKKVNQYILQKEIGAGNFAKVYECMNEHDHKSYAMKIIKKNKLKRQFQFSKKKAETFLETEMAILKKLDHPNVVALYEIINDQASDKLYFVQELVQGGSLASKINSKKGIAESDIRKYFRELIFALEYCHECAQVIHRDIKPENILIDENNTVRLADFGVSHIMIEGNDMIQNRAGSQFYFAPEVIKESKFHGRPIDIWACGVTLYQMLTKKIPFMSANVQELQNKILKEEPDYSQITNEVIIEILEKIFEKDPSKRITLPQIKEHSWITNNGQDPMPTLAGKKIEITEKDLKQVFTRVVKMARVINKFRNSSHSPIRH